MERELFFVGFMRRNLSHVNYVTLKNSIVVPNISHIPFPYTIVLPYGYHSSGVISMFEPYSISKVME